MNNMNTRSKKRPLEAYSESDDSDESYDSSFVVKSDHSMSESINEEPEDLAGTDYIENVIRKNIINIFDGEDGYEDSDPEDLDETSKKLNLQISHIYNSIDCRKLSSDKASNWSKKYSKDKINSMAIDLENINQKKLQEELSILKIMENENITLETKEKIIDKFANLQFMEPTSSEYQEILNSIKAQMNKSEKDVFCDQKIQELEYVLNSSEGNLKYDILNSKMSNENMKIVYDKYCNLEELKNSSDYGKQKEWITSLLKIPFSEMRHVDIQTNTVDYMMRVRKHLDENLSFMEKPKDEIINFISKIIKKPDSKTNNAIAIYGEPGIGKTRIVREGISKALNRPFFSIPLGGAKDSSFLLGHNFTYEGSTNGRIVDVLKQAKVMNPIIYFDELDKISDTPQGQEIIGVLTHLIDPSQNSEFYDNYFMGIKIDLSNVLFIFSYNDGNLLNDILSDRINKIKVDKPSPTEKIEICRKHIIPKMLFETGLEVNDVVFSDDCIKYIISKTDEPGCRDLSRKVGSIIERINTLNVCGNNPEIIKMGYNKLNAQLPVNLTKDIVDILIKQEKTDTSKHMHMYI